MEMVQPLLEKGYTLYLDNWYTSPILYLNLMKNDTNVIGTVRKKRKNMPKKLAAMAFKKGEVHTLFSRSLLALRWRDKKDVDMLSTKHSNASMKETGKKRRRKDGSEESVSKPACVIDYNRGMGGVDKQDQQLACFPVMRKFMKEYKIFFLHVRHCFV
ncbi:hypothetical protein J437_LFUL017262 [Ladona fulva]|uniref:PiggyBac transposable element-derived protein domain-containing protein n=1 Tax=Ladona fulva TaxID=123851 RepID=A0A8K0KMR8_LADFU|nr:hypothetical protein J437_LFUL017262 [Ladona fulva]